jgi:predicted transcriptional regulator
MGTRPDGALEHDIMAVLWAANEALAPSEIRERLPVDLAYTTVATVLGRLQTKGFVDRSDGGRAYRYLAIIGESELAARRMNDVLVAASDRFQTLAGFVGLLSPKDREALRAMLVDIGR